MKSAETMQVVIFILHNDQVLHLLVTAIADLHFGILAMVNALLLSGAHGALRGHLVSLVLLIRRVQKDVTLLILFHLHARLHSSLQHWRECSFSRIDIDVGTGLSLLESLV